MFAEVFVDSLIDALLDCLKMLPFLLAAYLLIEWLEHKTAGKLEKFITRAGKGGPAVGAVLGCVPQCGFSVACANLYSGGIITIGTLIAVFTSTSDEALAMLLADGVERLPDVLLLLASKVIIAIVFGFIIDLIFKNKKRAQNDICHGCGCSEKHGFVQGILLPALRHTASIMAFIFIITLVLNVCFGLWGEQISAILPGNDSILQPMLVALVGFIPNCAASVTITQLYIEGIISFGSAVAGLCTGAGIGLLVLLRTNKNAKDNMLIIGLMYAVAVISGIIIQLAM